MRIKLIALRLLSLVHKLGLARQLNNIHKSIAKVAKQYLMRLPETQQGHFGVASAHPLSLGIRPVVVVLIALLIV